MRNSWPIIYLTKDYEAFRAYFVESVGELQRTRVWASTWRHWQCHWTCHGQASLPKNWSFYDLTSWNLAEVLTVLTWRPLSKNFSLLVPGYKVHLQLLPLKFCASFVLFSIAKRERFEFLGWMNQTVIRCNQCFRKDLHVLYFCL